MRSERGLRLVRMGLRQREPIPRSVFICVNLRLHFPLLLLVLLAGCRGGEKDGAFEIDYQRPGSNQMQFTLMKVDEGCRYYVYQKDSAVTGFKGNIEDAGLNSLLADVFNGKWVLLTDPDPKPENRAEAALVCIRAKTPDHGWGQISNSTLIVKLRPVEDYVRSKVGAKR